VFGVQAVRWRGRRDDDDIFGVNGNKMFHARGLRREFAASANVSTIDVYLTVYHQQ